MSKILLATLLGSTLLVAAPALAAGKLAEGAPDDQCTSTTLIEVCAHAYGGALREPGACVGPGGPGQVCFSMATRGSGSTNSELAGHVQNVGHLGETVACDWGIAEGWCETGYTHNHHWATPSSTMVCFTSTTTARILDPVFGSPILVASATKDIYCT